MARAAWLVLGMLVGAGCNGPSTEVKDDTGVTADDTGGGGTGTLWRAAGVGTAYFRDGSVDNSLFHLEMTRCTEPRVGEAYYGWVSKGGEDPIAVGEISVSNEEVYFEGDIGVNAIIEGYDTFEAWASDNGGSAREGEALWLGEVDPIVYDVIQKILIASDDTPDGQGSLRSLESSVEILRNTAQEALDATFDVDSFHEAGETIANAIEGDESDRDENGRVDSVDGQLPIMGDTGGVELVLTNLAEASDQVTPGNPIKDFANYAYDCTQLVEAQAHLAALSADYATFCTVESLCDTKMTEAVEYLGYALNGYDANEDKVIDELSEGTIECAVNYVSQMAQMDVTTP